MATIAGHIALDRNEEAQHEPSQLVVRQPPERQKLGPFTIVCFIINRTVGQYRARGYPAVMLMSP